MIQMFTLFAFITQASSTLYKGISKMNDTQSNLFFKNLCSLAKLQTTLFASMETALSTQPI